MAKVKKLEIEFAFGLPSGAVLFVVAKCLTGALRKAANMPKSAMDRKKLARDVAMRPSEADDVQIGHDRLLWWTVLSAAGSPTFDGCVYPDGNDRRSNAWLRDRDAWQWGLAPGMTTVVPTGIELVVAAYEACTT